MKWPKSQFGKKNGRKQLFQMKNEFSDLPPSLSFLFPKSVIPVSLIPDLHLSPTSIFPIFPIWKKLSILVVELGNVVFVESLLEGGVESKI
jgi:hypothetical protein